MNLVLREYLYKLFYLFPMVLCFCLPFGTIYISPLIFFWTLTSFLVVEKKQLIQGLKSKGFLSFIIFFVLTVISAWLSQNRAEAAFSMEVKMTCVLFPYLLFCFRWPNDVIKRCIVSFVSGCFFASFYLILRASTYAYNGQSEYFFYTKFSYFIHASYFAMYLLTAIILILLFYFNWFKTNKSIIMSSYLFIAIFILSIFLCSSKLGLISAFICLPITVLFKFKEILNRNRILIIISSFVVLIIATYLFFPNAFTRFNSLNNLSVSEIDKTSFESSKVRLLIWKEALELIRTNFWMGVGVGDANDALYNMYQSKGLTGAFDHKLNAHNQFFQTFIGIGILGFLSLVYLTFGKMISGIRSGNFLLFIFSLIIILNFCVESMLQTAAGILFFAFFACLFELLPFKEFYSNMAPKLNNESV